jgi:hypothetical protein
MNIHGFWEVTSICEKSVFAIKVSGCNGKAVVAIEVSYCMKTSMELNVAIMEHL